MLQWVLFSDSCPECARYPEEQLDWLVEILVEYAIPAELEREAAIKAALLAMPLGKMDVIEGKRIVKIEWDKSKVQNPS